MSADPALRVDLAKNRPAPARLVRAVDPEAEPDDVQAGSSDAHRDPTQPTATSTPADGGSAATAPPASAIARQADADARQAGATPRLADARPGKRGPTGPAVPTGRVIGPLLRPVNPLARLAEPPEPTPWATGLPIAAFVAVFLTLADVALCRAFAEAFGWLWIPANLLVGVGLAPSLWLMRHTPLWRWPALGAAVGLGVSWVVLLLAMLAPPLS